jgi:hypothetical protein
MRTLPAIEIESPLAREPRVKNEMCLRLAQEDSRIRRNVCFARSGQVQSRQLELHRNHVDQ